MQVEWRITGDLSDVDDFTTNSGTTTILADRDSAEIIINIIADDESELDETFKLELIGVKGGAEIDSQFNTATFSIR